MHFHTHCLWRKLRAWEPSRSIFHIAKRNYYSFADTVETIFCRSVSAVTAASSATVFRKVNAESAIGGFDFRKVPTWVYHAVGLCVWYLHITCVPHLCFGLSGQQPVLNWEPPSCTQAKTLMRSRAYYVDLGNGNQWPVKQSSFWPML